MKLYEDNDASLCEQGLSSELIYDGKIVHLYRDEVRLPNGKTALREVIRHVGAVCVVPLTEQGEVICVRQYRYAVGQVLLEIPAGKLDSPDEDPDAAVLPIAKAGYEVYIFVGDIHSAGVRNITIDDANLTMITIVV